MREKIGPKPRYTSTGMAESCPCVTASLAETFNASDIFGLNPPAQPSELSMPFHSTNMKYRETIAK